MKEEMRTHLLGSSENGKQKQKQLIHGRWEQQEGADEKCPIDASSSSVTLTLVVTVFISVLGSFTFGFAVSKFHPEPFDFGSTFHFILYIGLFALNSDGYWV